MRLPKTHGIGPASDAPRHPAHHVIQIKTSQAVRRLDAVLLSRGSMTRQELTDVKFCRQATKF